jgi:hypothetical protein
MAEHFAGSTEFLARYGPLDDADYVRRLYLNVLRREPDPAGLDHWSAALRGGHPFPAIVAGFLDATEYRLRILLLGYLTHPLPTG